MSAKLLQKLSGFWRQNGEEETIDGKHAGDHVFYPTMEALRRAPIKNGAIAMQTTLGFWVRKEDHVG